MCNEAASYSQAQAETYYSSAQPYSPRECFNTGPICQSLWYNEQQLHANSGQIQPSQ